MQKDSAFPCFAASGEQTASQLRDRFQPTLTHSLVGDYLNRLIDTSLGSHWTRLYDSVSVLQTSNGGLIEHHLSINTIRNPYYNRYTLHHRTLRRANQVKLREGV